MRHHVGFGLGLLGMAFLLGCGGSVETDPESGEGGEGGSGGDVTVASGGSDVASGGIGSGGGATGGAGSGGSATGGAGGAVDEVCAAMRLVTLSAPTLVEAGGDLTWSPGESATFRIAMTNESVNDNTFYPGISAIADVAGVSVGTNTLFGLLGSQTTELDVVLTADASVPAPSQVRLEFLVTTLNMECEGLASVTASFTIE